MQAKRTLQFSLVSRAGAFAPLMDDVSFGGNLNLVEISIFKFLG